MTALPLQPVYGHPNDYGGQHGGEYAFLDLPASAPGSGASSAYVSPTPAMAHYQPHPNRPSPTHMHPSNSYGGSPNHDGQWWDPSGGDSTPPSANGHHTTPPNVPNGPHGHPQYSVPHSGDMYTPMYPGSQLVTPSTQPYHAGPMGSSAQSASYTRPPMTTSLSYPGPMFAGGSHMPMMNGDKGDNGLAFQQTPGPSQGYHFGMPPPPPPHMYRGETPQHQMAFHPGPNGLMTTDEWVGEWEDDEHQGEWYNGTMEIKHRRRTSPEQLKVLEHWFDINSKPDNALREWLAGELGMTKRNVQVWFQNRRAKIKGQMIRDRAAQEKAAKDAEGQKTPEGQIMSARPTPVPAPLPHPFPRELRERAEQQFYGDNQPAPAAAPVSDRSLSLAIPTLPNGGRRVSLASGEADRIQAWAAKRNGAAPSLGAGATGRSPVVGQASAARRGSIPYPAPLTISTDMGGRPGSGASSPKFSPLVRPAPSTLHLTAIRNNTRRASMPGPPQLLSSGPFTPPRVVSYPVSSTAPNGRPPQLTSIKDSEADLPSADPSFNFSESDFSTTFLTPPSSTYDPSSTYPTSLSTSISSAPGQGGFEDFAKLGDAQNASGPFPNPAFSFGKNVMFSAIPEDQQADETRRAQAIYESIQQRGRIGSLASVRTCDSDGTGGTGATSAGTGDDLDFGDFDPNRRASAPSGLLDLGLLGITSFNGFSGSNHRPSPLGANFTSSEPTLQPPYIQANSNQYNQHQLSVPPSSEQHSPSDGSLHASPVEMVMSASMSAPTSLRSQSPHTPQGTSPTHPPNFTQVQTQYRSLSASAKDPLGNGDGEDFWNFPAESGDGGFSLMVPTMTVSAPASAYPGSVGESQQQGLMAPADIPGKEPGSHAGSRRSSIGIGGGSS